MHLKDLNNFFQKMVCLIDFGVTIRDILRVNIPEKLLSQQKYYNSVFLRVDILLMLAIVCRNCDWFLLPSAENTKMVHF